MAVNRHEALLSLTAPGEAYELIEVEMFANRRARVFKNAPLTLPDIYATTRSDLPFLVYEGERLTFEETWLRSCALAHALAHRVGIEKGDRVAIAMRNFPEWVIAFNAITSIGAIAVAMNALWQTNEMEFGLRDSGARFLFADAERLERLSTLDAAALGLSICCVRAGDTLPVGVTAFSELVRAPYPDIMPERVVFPDDDATMFYTSGSTGHPKGVVSTHRNIISALLSWELDARASIVMGASAEPDPAAPQAATLLGVPLFHVSGSHAVLLGSYRAQRRIISMYRWDPELAAELIERERISTFVAPSAMTGDLVHVALRSKRDLSSLAVVGGGGAARAPEQVRAIDRVFPNARPNTGWGMTETNAIGAGTLGAEYLARPESAGRVSAVLDIRIVDESGHVAPPLSRGELQVRGASVMRGYWRRPDANAEAFDGEWLRTGDIAYLDDEGFLFIVDRIKDLVIRGGENISCGAVEAAMMEHPDVREACVYGVPDPRLGEEVGATLYAPSPLDEEALRSFLMGRVARFSVPRYIHFAGGPLPRLASGKIMKARMREDAIARLEAQRIDAERR